MGTIPSLTDCEPGLQPVEFNVLIAPEVIEEKTKGGIILTDTVKDTDRNAATRGRLVAVSPCAFDYAEWPQGTRRPQPGDEVWFGKYAGTLIQGRDGKDYRLCKDRDIGAIVL
jgi:co-chaperonin GroES (HSP10)